MNFRAFEYLNSWAFGHLSIQTFKSMNIWILKIFWPLYFRLFESLDLRTFEFSNLWASEYLNSWILEYLNSQIFKSPSIWISEPLDHSNHLSHSSSTDTASVIRPSTRRRKRKERREKPSFFIYIKRRGVSIACYFIPVAMSKLRREASILTITRHGATHNERVSSSLYWYSIDNLLAPKGVYISRSRHDLMNSLRKTARYVPTSRVGVPLIRRNRTNLHRRRKS